MVEPEERAAAPPGAPIPRSFWEYMRSMGPGIVIALTWLGAGDIVDSAVAGGNYGYALMWGLALALVVRWLFVSTIAKYQLCNRHGESVLEGLRRLHPIFPPFILVGTIVFSHAVGVYMYQGLGESCSALARGGTPWVWALGWAVVFYLVVRRPVFRRMEIVFLLFLGLLSVSLLTAAAWVGPDFRAILAGTVGFRLPPQKGAFDSLVVVTSLIGAVGGSLANLMYPYLIREKGWTTPAHRRVQFYDLGFGVLVMIVLDLAVWVLGAEVLLPRQQSVTTTHDLANLLREVIGPGGAVMIYLGIFAAVGSSILGNAFAFSYLATDAYLTWRPPPGGAAPEAYRSHPGYRWMTLWILFSPLVWVIAGRTNFVALTVSVNAFQVIGLPILAGALWAITSFSRYIGARYRNNLWENALMAALFAMAVYGAHKPAAEIVQIVRQWLKALTVL